MKLIQPVKPMSKQRGNIITARIVPVFLLGLVGYSSYVVTRHVCIDYLINPTVELPSLLRPDVGAAAAVLTIYYLLLLIMLVCFGRLIQTVFSNPGLVPRGSHYYVEQERAHRERDGSGANTKEGGGEYELKNEGYTPRHLRAPPQDDRATAIRAQDFWHKDVFVCGWDGRPPFCSTCYNYKPDRAHHCSELGRCVIKMDHFCPWVGGIVSETSFKYFIQFTGWAAVYCLDTMILMAYYFAKRRREEGDFINVHWILVLVLAGLFFLFAGGMCGSSLQFAFINSTTIENFNRKTKVWYLAVHLPRPVLQRYENSGRSDLRLISYPRPATEQFEILQQNGAKLNDSQQSIVRDGWEAGNDATTTTTVPANTYDPQSASSFPPHPAVARNTPPSSRGDASVSPPQSARPPTNTTTTTTTTTTQTDLRTFAILETEPGANPFDLGLFGNFKQVMGYNMLDWLVPLRPSPLTDHRDPTCFYKIGPVVDDMKEKAGIMAAAADGEGGAKQRRKGSRRHRRKRQSHSAAPDDDQLSS